MYPNDMVQRCNIVVTGVQRAVLDVMALSLGIACSMRPARAQLTSSQPPIRLCTVKNCTLLTATVLLCAGMSATACWFLTIQPWYTGGTGTSYKVSVHHTLT